MMLGDPTIWVSRFRSVDNRFLKCVIRVWPKCVARLPSQPNEDSITTNLISILLKDPQARRLFHSLVFHYEPFGYMPNGEAYSKGQIDMALVLDQVGKYYLAYECKRLNVVYRDKKHSLAGTYVTNGLSRFIKEQYSESLSVGCMLGYVIDGNTSAAQSKVCAAITKEKSLIELTKEPTLQTPLGDLKRFLSRHRRPSNQDIEVRHALIPFSKNT